MFRAPFLQYRAMLEYTGCKLTETKGGQIWVVLSHKILKVPLGFLDLKVDALKRVSLLGLPVVVKC